MLLTARVVSDLGQAPDELAKTFNQEGGTIGRSSEADWTLPDPSSCLSREHARIFFQGDSFYIEDTSTNGVYRIDTTGSQPISKTACLGDGDRFQLGDYEIHIEVNQEREPNHKSFEDLTSGFAALKLDETLLAESRIAISSAQGFFTDGVEFKIPEEVDPPEPLKVPQDTRDSTVYLTNESIRSGNKPRVHLSLKQKDWDQSSYLGVARVAQLLDSKTLLLDAQYIPQVTNCRAAPVLLQFVEELSGLLRNRGESLASRISNLNASEIANFMTLQLVNRYEPIVEHLLSMRELHPEALYQLMVQILSELSTFTEDSKRPPKFQAYRHDNLQATFQPVIAHLRKQLSSVMKADVVSIPLSHRKHGIYTASFSKGLLENSHLILSVKDSRPASKLRSQLLHEITIAPVEQIAQLVNTGQPGVTMVPLPVAPKQIPYQSDCLYFKLALDRASQWFAPVNESRGLALHVSADSQDVDMQLWAISRETLEEAGERNSNLFPGIYLTKIKASYMPAEAPVSEPTEGSVRPDNHNATPISDSATGSNWFPEIDAHVSPKLQKQGESKGPEEKAKSDADKIKASSDREEVSDSTPSDDEVQFTVYRPTAVRPLVWYTLLAFTHRSALSEDAAPDELPPIDQVKEQANRSLGSIASRYASVTQDGGFPISKSGEITLIPEIPGFEFNPPYRSFLWEETIQKEEFRLRAGACIKPHVARGRMTIFFGGIILADVALNIRIDEAAPSTQDKADLSTDSSTVYKKIFASYSHKDTGIIEQVAEYAKALGDEYLIDLTHLRAGERWSEGLQQLIKGSNIFQLFWSSNSMRSPFVRREWEYALSLRRTGFIRPTYWEQPLPSNLADNLPPEELRQLHFQQINLRQVPQPAPFTLDTAISQHQPSPTLTSYKHSTPPKRSTTHVIWIGVLVISLLVVWVLTAIW